MSDAVTGSAAHVAVAPRGEDRSACRYARSRPKRVYDFDSVRAMSAPYESEPQPISYEVQASNVDSWTRRPLPGHCLCARDFGPPSARGLCCAITSDPAGWAYR
jgi:hypothetical protein